MKDETGRSNDWHERVAEGEFLLFGGPAFAKRTGRGSGPLTREQERERYDRFCRVMRAYDAAREGAG